MFDGDLKKLKDQIKELDLDELANLLRSAIIQTIGSRDESFPTVAEDEDPQEIRDLIIKDDDPYIDALFKDGNELVDSIIPIESRLPIDPKRENSVDYYDH